MPRKPRTPKHDPFWETRADWVKKVEKVMLLMSKGMNENQIIALSDVPQMEVKRIMEDEKHVKAIVARVENDAIPLLKRCQGMSLEILSIELQLMLDENYRRRFIKDTKDLIGLMQVAKEMSLLSRLYGDKSTQNLAIATSGHSAPIQPDPIFSALTETKKEDAN